MIRFVALLACLICAPPAMGQTTVKGDWIALGDIVPVAGEAASILIGPSPPPGETLALDPGFIASVARKSGVILAIPLDTPIWVTRAGGDARPANPANTARPANTVTASEPERGEVLVLVRDVGRGHRIAEVDLEWAEASTARTVRNGATDMSAAVGMETRRALRAGQPIQTSDLKPAALVRKGQPVKLIYAAPGLRLTVDGLAQADAAKGESVRVLNTYSKRMIEAVAEAEGEAYVSR